MGGEVNGAQVTDAQYRGVDERGRPYTVTASTAVQVGPEKVNLTDPKGDITQENGTWLMLQSKQGVYIQHANQLDLFHDVVLYRDDGAMLRTETASIDLKNGAAANAEPVKAEGPFGTLDAQGFTITEKGAAIQFAGPARLVMNAHSQ
jgi:lipopolysaccharide export system protein LptC